MNLNLIMGYKSRIRIESLYPLDASSGCYGFRFVTQPPQCDIKFNITTLHAAMFELPMQILTVNFSTGTSLFPCLITMIDRSNYSD